MSEKEELLKGIEIADKAIEKLIFVRSRERYYMMTER